MTENNTLTTALQADHERLDALLAQARQAGDDGAAADAGEAFRQFRAGLEHHIAIEEQVLFPAFEQRTGMTGPTQVMRMEHEAIREALEAGAAALAKADAGAFARPAESLARTLADHNAKEEHMLYPMADRALAATEVAGVVSRLGR